MKQELSPVVFGVIIAVVVIVIGLFVFKGTATPPPREASPFGDAGGAAAGPGRTPDTAPQGGR